jgi:hypothetical protein
MNPPVRPLVIREWSTPIDNYAGAIWQAQWCPSNRLTL